MTCDFCGHDICEHGMVGMKVVIEGMQALPKEKDICHEAVVLSERRHLFSKPKVNIDEISKSKSSGLITA